MDCDSLDVVTKAFEFKTTSEKACVDILDYLKKKGAKVIDFVCDIRTGSDIEFIKNCIKNKDPKCGLVARLLENKQDLKM